MSGSSAIARAIAARFFMPPDRELGGKSASIVYADADLDLALDGALLGSFMNNGQMCLAGSRIFVQRRVAEPFIERFAARTKALSVGGRACAMLLAAPLARRRWWLWWLRLRRRRFGAMLVSYRSLASFA